MSNCSVAACDRRAEKRGMCRMHYLRWWKHGDPLHIPVRSYRRPVLDRLLHGAARLENGCLIFAGGPQHKYGQLQVNNRAVLAHRISYEQHIGPIPEGLLVLHRCDTPRCIEPSHLFLGTPKDNTQDMLSKGRGRYQGNHPCQRS